MDQLGVSSYHRQLVRDAAIAHDLQPYIEQIQALVRPSVVLATSRAEARSIPVGGSKIGGAPDMPDSLEWPVWNEQPLGFLGQINLTEIAPFQLGLPSDGLLLFFFCFDSDLMAPWPQNTSAGVVYYVQAEKLTPRKSPQRARERFRKCAVRYVPYPSLPQGYNDEVATLWGLDFLVDDETDAAYAECIRSIDEALGIDKLPTRNGYNYHQLLGYPDAVQFAPIEVSMERARIAPSPPPQHSLWEDFKNFILSRNPPIYTNLPEAPRPPADPVQCRDWRLLLMLREDEHAGIGLIDSGCLYYMYPSEQLQCGDFSNPWTMLDFM
jgi:hypothetical protein